LQDLISNFIHNADDGDATSEHDEAAVPLTDGGDVEAEYEISEADDDAGPVDHLEDADPMLILAASIPLPDDEDDGLEEGIDRALLVDDVGAGNATASTSTGVAGPSFSLPGTWFASEPTMLS
jgi:hypothetical protein